MTNESILWITLIIYLIGMLFSYLYDMRIIMFVSILWLVPVFILTNTIIILFCVIMFILHIVISFSEYKGSDFD